MDFPSQYPDSPAKPLAGPARARVLARQNRTSSLKPYARPSSGLVASGSSASLHSNPPDSPAASAASKPSTPKAAATNNNNNSLAPPAAAAQSSRSAFSPLRVAASPIALLGSVRKMVTKPLSWLTTAAAAVEPELGIPTSSSTNSLSSIARRRAAAHASIKSNSAADDSYERDAPTRAARAVGERLAAGLRSRSNLHDDEENQLRPPSSSALSSSMSMSRLAPGPAPPRATRNQSPYNAASPLAGPSSLPKVAASGSSDKAMTWSSRSSKRMLDIGGPRSADPNDPLEVLSDAGPTSPPPQQAQPYHSRSHRTLRSPRSQLLGYRGSSLRPDDAMSESGSTSMSHSNSFSAFGYGNEVRYADSAFGLPPSSSPFQLSSRRNRAPFTSSLLTDTATPGRTSRAGSASLRDASPAPSAGYSPARPRAGTPQRRNWNGINLAAASAPSVGDEMMREYLASRTLPGINPTVRRSLGLPADEPMITSSSVAGGSMMDETESLTPSRLGKRDIDMSVDGDSERLGAMGTPSKRRMVWHPELGFISHEELKAREPKLPSPKNEAERLLNVLETLRKPINTARGVGLNKAPPATINVPAPVSDLPATAGRNAKSQDGKPSVGVAPYTRYMRKAKAIQSTEEQGGMRARLKKIQPKASSRADVMETDDAATEESAASENDNVAEEEEDEEEQEEEPAPQPEPVRRSRRLQHQPPSSTTEQSVVAQTPVKQAAKQADKAAAPPRAATQLKSALKATPLRPSASQAQATTPAAVTETPKPASHRIPLSAANKAPSSTIKKDNFSVKTSSDPSAPRERSSLRQGAAKTSRTHQSSGKFSAWDEDEEEEDLPDASELAKIKLPTNMFPSGFSFGSSSSSTSATSAPPAAASKPATAAESKSAPSSDSAGGSLLGRLEGFDSTSASEKKDETAKPAAFSFSAPSKDAPNTMPNFSFGAPASSKDDSTTSTASAPTKKSTAPPASDFFSKPAEPAMTSTLGEGKRDGPVPNFFGSTMKKFETSNKDGDGPTASAPATSGSSSGGFSFGAPAAASTEKPASFSFGASKAITTPTATNNPFGGSTGFGSTSKPASAAADNTDKKTDDAPAASKPCFFGSSSAGSGGFSFGAPSTSSTTTTIAAPAAASTGSKRGADEDQEPAAKKSMPSFSFGSSSTSTPAASSGFSFGTPTASGSGDKKEETSNSGVPNFFGAEGDATPSSSSSVGGGFSFSKPATESTGGFSFGTPKPPASDNKPATTGGGGFSFGSGVTESKTSTFTFGSGMPSAAGAKPASEAAGGAGSGATTPTFSFGNPSAANDASKPSSGASTGGFTFGSSSTTTASTGGFGNSSADSDGAGGGFGGFTTSKPLTTTGAGGGGEMMDDSPAKSVAAVSSSAPSFTFGSSSTPASNPTAASGKPASTFTFGSSPAPASSSTFTFGATPSSNPAPTSNSTTTGAGGGGFRFGSPAPNPTPSSAPAPAPTSTFTFGSNTGGSTTPGVGSTPASPFLAPQGATITPGGSPFQFGSTPQPPSSAASGGGFQFATSNTTNSQPLGGFTFGNPSSTPAAGFGTPNPTFGGGFGTPTLSTTPAPSGGFTFGGLNGMPQLPNPTTPGASGGGAMFNMGAGPAPGSTNSSGGRQIKPLRQRRR